MWNRIHSFRDRFRLLDRKWHALIGSQILFGLIALRFHNTKEYPNTISETTNKDSETN